MTPSVSFVEYGGKRKKREAINPPCVWSHIACVESQVKLAWERSMSALVQEQINPPFFLYVFVFLFVFFVSLTKTKKKSGGGCMGEL